MDYSPDHHFGIHKPINETVYPFEVPFGEDAVNVHPSDPRISAAPSSFVQISLTGPYDNVISASPTDPDPSAPSMEVSPISHRKSKLSCAAVSGVVEVAALLDVLINAEKELVIVWVGELLKSTVEH